MLAIGRDRWSTCAGETLLDSRTEQGLNLFGVVSGHFSYPVSERPNGGRKIGAARIVEKCRKICLTHIEGRKTHPKKAPTPINPPENSVRKRFAQTLSACLLFNLQERAGQFARTAPKTVHANSFYWGGWFLGWVFLP